MNIRINTKTTNLELTPSLQSYIEKKLHKLERFIHEHGTETMVHVEISKVRNHHHKGDIFECQLNVRAADKLTYNARAENEDLYTAIDTAKDELLREVTSAHQKQRTLFRHGAIKIKNFLKGFTRRAP